jgi:hypothetical protein
MKMTISKMTRWWYYTAIGMFLIILLIPKVVYAADLSAVLVPERDRAEVSYIGVKTVTLQYPAGSQLAQEFDGKNERI